MHVDLALVVSLLIEQRLLYDCVKNQINVIRFIGIYTTNYSEIGLKNDFDGESCWAKVDLSSREDSNAHTPSDRRSRGCADTRLL